MDGIIFSHEAHRRFFYTMLRKCGRKEDPYCRAFFYTVGITGETRRHVEDLFDFVDMGINPEALHAGWQTGGTARLTRLAFNLWNGWTEEGGEHLSSPYELFDCGLAPYFWEAIKLRYPEYCNQK